MWRHTIEWENSDVYKFSKLQRLLISFVRFYTKNLYDPNVQSAHMAHVVAILITFQKKPC